MPLSVYYLEILTKVIPIGAKLCKKSFITLATSAILTGVLSILTSAAKTFLAVRFRAGGGRHRRAGANVISILHV